MIAMAKSVDVVVTQDDFQLISNKIPVLADLKPSGKYLMEDLHNIGGVPAVMKYLLKLGWIDGSCLTVTGKTIAENLVDVPELEFENQKIIFPAESPPKTRDKAKRVKLDETNHSAYDTQSPRLVRTRTGRRPIRSDRRPQKGEPTNCRRA